VRDQAPCRRRITAAGPDRQAGRSQRPRSTRSATPHGDPRSVRGPHRQSARALNPGV
jgi:hypothetical protein